MGLLKGSGTPAEKAEHEGAAGFGRLLDRDDTAIESGKEHCGNRELQEQGSERDLREDPECDRPPGHEAALLAQQPRNQQQYDEAEGTLYVLQPVAPLITPVASSSKREPDGKCSCCCSSA